MTQEGLLEIEDIQETLVIDRKFVLVDSSKYTPGAFDFILTKIDEVGSIGFISDLLKIYAQGRFYSDFETLKFFKNISTGAYDSLGRLDISYVMSAKQNSDNLTFVAKGFTTIELDEQNNAIVVDTDLSSMEEETKGILERLERIELSYATQEYVADNYQEILIPGAYIQINEDNVITTYDLVSYTYAFENYGSYSYIAMNNEYFFNFERFVKEWYADRIETKEIAAQAAAEAVAQVVDGAPNVFDTLKEIAEWIVDSGQYILVNPEDLDDSGNTKYYIKQYTELTNKNFDKTGNTDYYEYKSETLYVEVPKSSISFDDGNEYYYKDENDEYVPVTSDSQFYTYNPISVDDIDLESDNEYFYKDENGEYVKVNPEDTLSFDKEYYIKEEINNTYYVKQVTEPDYRLVNISDIDLTDENREYYSLDYVDAPMPIDTSGETDYYIYSSTSAVEMLNEISELKEKVGEEYYFSYITADNTRKVYDGTISSIQHLEDNNYLIEDNEGNLIEASYIASTGLFGKIEIADKELSDRIDEVNRRIDEILEEFNGILYKLYADTRTSYAYLTFDEYEYKGYSERTIIMNLVEADFDNNPESSYYGQVITNGLATSYTVNSMLDYRNGWVILQGEEELPPIVVNRIRLIIDNDNDIMKLSADCDNIPENPKEEIIFHWYLSFDGVDEEENTNSPEMIFDDFFKNKYNDSETVTVYLIVSNFESNLYYVKKPEG